MLEQSFGKDSQDAFKIPPVAQLMETLRRQLDSRELTPIIGKVFTLDEVPVAMHCLLQGTTLGRIAISIH
jgi:NADPH:quinone reductase-like Zn-dependent oxidoreductase